MTSEPVDAPTSENTGKAKQVVVGVVTPVTFVVRRTSLMIGNVIPAGGAFGPALEGMCGTEVGR